MDLLSAKIHWPDAHVRLVVADASGERGIDLSDDAFARVAEAALPLKAKVASAANGATVRAISLEMVQRRLLASLDGGAPALRYDGDALTAFNAEILAIVRAAFAEIRPRKPDPAGTPSDADFWTGLYLSGGDGWELNRAAPPLERWLRTENVHGLRTLVVGCGRGNEARLFARAGAQVLGVDFSPEAISAAKEIAIRQGDLSVQFQLADLFELPRLPARYDLVVEHCCYCAIDPNRRAEYVATLAKLVVPGGRVVGLFYAHERAGGPPFTTSLEELRALWSPRFCEEHAEIPTDSVASRVGQEILMAWRRT